MSTVVSVMPPQDSAPQKRTRTIDLVMSAAYLYISSFTTCILMIDKYHVFCFYKVGGLVLIDFALHHTNIYRLQPDMYLHHIFVVCFGIYFFYHYCAAGSLPSGREESTHVLRVLLGTEVSTIFYSINNISAWFRRHNESPARGLPTLALHVNGLCFAAAFFYMRLYNYYVGLIAREEFHRLIRAVSLSPLHKMYLYGAIYGLFTLNLYWTTKIVQKFLPRARARPGPIAEKTG